MVSLYEYDQAGHMELVREEALEQGIEQGATLRTAQIQQVFSILTSENRIDDIRRACEDTDYLNKLLEKYNKK